MFSQPPPSANDRSAELAEQRWQIEVERFKKRQIVVGIGIAACIVAAYAAAKVGQPVLAGLCVIGTLAGLARVITLAVKVRRLFTDIKMTGGMTKEEASSEWMQRYGGS